MKFLVSWFFFLGFFMLMSSCAGSQGVASELKVVPSLDLDRYLGTWHQVAAIPAWFQKVCATDVTANYKMDGNQIQVTNRCLKEDKTEKVSVGRARLNPKDQSPAKLQVTFVKIFSWAWIFGGNYWVIELADDYSYAVVGEPSRDYLWILSRTPSISRELLTSLSKKIKDHKYDIEKIFITQEGDLKNKTLGSLVTLN